MTKLDFILLCGEFLLSPELVIENDQIRNALEDKDDEKVKELLKTEF